MSTPINAPDFAEVRESIPAIPATKATKKEKKSGLAMKSVSGWLLGSKSSGDTPRARNASTERSVISTPAGNPTARAASERRAKSGRRSTRATDSPASGPNSGPTTIAPTIRIGWSRRMPTAAICMARIMKATKLTESSVFSLVRCSTSSHTTASEGSPRAARSALLAESEITLCTSSTEIDPKRGISSSLRSPMITLASSRATSQRIRSPSGRCAAPSRCTTLMTDGELQRISMARSARSGGATIRRWSIRPSGPGPPGHAGVPLGVSASLTATGIARLRSVSGSTNTWRSSPSTSSSPFGAPLDVEGGGHGRGAQVHHLGHQVDLVVEAGRRPVGDPGLGHHHVGPRVHHLAERDHHVPPELGHGDVEVREVVGVEDDPLKVALGPANPHPVSKRLVHAARVPAPPAGPPAKELAAWRRFHPPPGLACEHMFPGFRDRFGAALDLIVEFSTLGEYGLAAGAAGSPSAPRTRLRAGPAAGRRRRRRRARRGRRNVVGGAVASGRGSVPSAPHPARPPPPRPGGWPARSAGRETAATRRARSGGLAPRAYTRRTGAPEAQARPKTGVRCRGGAPAAPEQLCLAV